jgi:DNA-binding response OmpR family regulator
MGHLQGRVILVVEDEPLVRLDLGSILKAEGARVCSARTVEDALILIGDHDLCLALLDINLGKTDCSEIYQTCAERGIPVIFHTGYTREHVARTWSNAVVLSKPVTPRQIVEAIVQRLRG